MEKEKEKVDFCEVKELLRWFSDDILPAMARDFPELNFLEAKEQLKQAEGLLHGIDNTQQEIIKKARWLAKEATKVANTTIIGFTKSYVEENEKHLNGKHSKYIEELDRLKKNLDNRSIKPQSIGLRCSEIISEIEHFLNEKRIILETKGKELEKKYSEVQEIIISLENEFAQCPKEKRYALVANLDALRESANEFQSNPDGVWKLICSFKDWFEFNRDYYRS